MKQAEDEAIRALMLNRLPSKPCLLKEAAAGVGEGVAQVCIARGMDKEAAAMVGTDTVDAVLALNFLNPENVSTFLENLPQLEEASTKLAALVLATQIGMKTVPKTAAVRAMFALEDVINGLKSLKEHRI